MPISTIQIIAYHAKQTYSEHLLQALVVAMTDTMDQPVKLCVKVKT